MRKAVLLFNPLAGRRRQHRMKDVQAAMAVLRQGGVEATMAPTRGPADSVAQVRQAIEEGYDTVFACGGDGTMHDVLQGLAGTQVALGLIPLGTANTLAHDIRIPRSPVRAAQAALQAEPRRMALGKVECQSLAGEPVARYFTVTVGVGVDAHLFYRLNALMKGHLGMMVYYWRATWLLVSHRMQNFSVEVPSGGDAGKRDDVSQLLAVRIRNFGGVLRELAPGASLERNDLRVVMFRTTGRLTYLRYVTLGMAGMQKRMKGVEAVHAEELRCSAHDPAGPRIFVEADGELLGTLPATISVAPDAVTLLVPR